MDSFHLESPFSTASKPSAFLQSRLGQNVQPAFTPQGNGVAAVKAALIEAGEAGMSLRMIRQRFADTPDVDACVKELLRKGIAGYRIPAILLSTLSAERKTNNGTEACIAPRLVALSTVQHYFAPVTNLLARHTRRELLKRVEMSSSISQRIGDAVAIAHHAKLTFERRLERAVLKFTQSTAGLETGDIAAAFS